MNVLVIENDRTCREVICFLIEEQGHSAEGLAASEYAWAGLKRKEFDAVFLDLDLGPTSGLELLSGILGYQPDLPVVMYAAEFSEEVAIEGMRRGAIDFLEIPFQRKQFGRLFARLQHLNQMRRRSQQAEREAKATQAPIVEANGSLGRIGLVAKEMAQPSPACIGTGKESESSETNSGPGMEVSWCPRQGLPSPSGPFGLAKKV